MAEIVFDDVKKILKVSCPYSDVARDFLKGLGGRWSRDERCWSIMPDINKYNRIERFFSEIDIDDVSLKLLEKYWEQKKQLSEIQELAKSDTPINLKIPFFKPERKLLNYQKLGVKFAINGGDGILIADEMGLGKCKPKDSFVQTVNGKKTYEELFNKYFDKNNGRKDGNGTWYELNELSLLLLGLVDGRLEFQNANRIYREKVDKIGRLELQDGSVQKSALNHSYLTLGGWKKLKDLQKDEWIAVPNNIYVPEPNWVDPRIIELLAWQISEGSEGKGVASVCITQDNLGILNRLKNIFDSFGFVKRNNVDGNIKSTIASDAGRHSSYLRFNSVEYREYIEELGYEFGYNSGEKMIPKIIQDCQIEGVKLFLRSYFDAEGSVIDNSNIEITSKSRRVIDALHYMIRRFGILGVIHSKFAETSKGKEQYWRMNIGGIYARIFNEKIGFGYKEKQDKLNKLCESKCNTNVGYSVPCKDLLQELSNITNLSHRELGLQSSVYISDKSSHQNPSKSLVWNVIERLNNILNYGLEKIENPRWKERRNQSIQNIKKYKDRIIEIKNKLEFLSSCDIIWLKIKNIEIEEYDDYVYDFEIDGEHNYISDMTITHNSVEAIATSLWHKKYNDVKKVLVVTPASVKWNWELEINKFCSESYIIIDGTPAKRKEQWKEDKFFYVANYELLVRDLGTVIKKDDFDMVVLDEIHYIKTHRAQRTKTVKKLVPKYKMGLSGTPIDGRLEELHSIFQFIKPGLFPSKSVFLDAHAIRDWWGSIKDYKDIDKVKSTIESYFIRRKKNQVLKELPDKIYKDIFIDLGKEERKVYRALKDRVHELTEDTQVMTAVLRCRQFCDHPFLIGEYEVRAQKMDVLDELVSELIDNGHRILIFTQYSKMTELICKRFEEVYKYLYLWGGTDMKERANMQAQFNNDKSINMMIMTEAGSTGLNFTGADVVIHYDDNWMPTFMQQREDRAHRIGQDKTVMVIRFITRKTVEERVREVLDKKIAITSAALEDNMLTIPTLKISNRDLKELV